MGNFTYLPKSALRTALTGFALILAGASAPANAVVLDFEDVTAPSFLPTDYHGLTFSGGDGELSWVIGTEGDGVFPGTETHSPSQYAWSNGATNLSISGALFDFNSMWARTGADFTINGAAIARGFSGVTELYTVVLDLTPSYQFFALNFIGIDSWTLTDQNGNVLLDDITLNDSPNDVPEPITLGLLGAGLVGIGAMRRRSQAAK